MLKAFEESAKVIATDTRVDFQWDRNGCLTIMTRTAVIRVFKDGKVNIRNFSLVLLYIAGLAGIKFKEKDKLSLIIEPPFDLEISIAPSETNDEDCFRIGSSTILVRHTDRVIKIWSSEISVDMSGYMSFALPEPIPDKIRNKFSGLNVVPFRSKA